MIDKENYWHPKFFLVRELIGILYNLETCGCGGCCHIVTDDNNIYDDDLDFVIRYCERKENKNRIDRELSITICEILKTMNFTQRAVLFEIMGNDCDCFFTDYNKDEVDFVLDDILDKSIEEIYDSYDYRNNE